MKVKVQVETETFVRFWLVIAGLVLAALLIYVSRSGLILIGIALLLAVTLNAPVSRLAKRMPGKSRIAGTAVSFILIVGFLAAFIFFAVPPIVQQSAKFVSTIPTIVDDLQSRSHVLNEFVKQYDLQPQVDEAIESLKSNATRWASALGSNLLVGIGSLASVVASTFLVLVLAFLMLVEGPAWMRRVWSLYHDTRKRDSHKRVIERMYRIVAFAMAGQLAVSAIGATFAGLSVFVISFFFPIPGNLALPIAAVTFLLSLIPMFGTTIAGALAALLLSLSSLPAAIVYVVYFIIYQQIENNFVSPTIQSKNLDLSPLVVLVGLTIGLYAFGFLGALISIPVTGCVKVLIEEYINYLKRTKANSKQVSAGSKNS